MIDLKEAISPYSDYCDGFASPGASGKGYFLGFTLGVGKSKLELSHRGSDSLDGINAFDRAEVDDINIGQLNMMTVSSFCGLAGAAWGYHVVRSASLFNKHPLLRLTHLIDEDRNLSIPVYSAAPLIDATRSLIGTVDNKRFSFLPGSHVHCASKSLKQVGPAHIYAGFAFGVAEDPEKNANLLMEDVGEIPLSISENEFTEKEYKSTILEHLAKSVLEIAKNQKINYKEIFVELKDIRVGIGEIGCALVALPYFTLARKAVPFPDPNKLRTLSLEEWEKMIHTGL